MNTKSRKTKAKASKLFPDELIDQLLSQVQNKDAESILGESGLAGQLKKQLAERMLAAERPHLTTEAPVRRRSLLPVDFCSRAAGRRTIATDACQSVLIVRAGPAKHRTVQELTKTRNDV